MALLDAKKSLVLIKASGSPAAADFVETEEIVIANPEVSSGEIQRLTGLKNSVETYVDTNHSLLSVSMTTALRGNDDTGLALDTPPQVAEVYKLCGLSETVGVDTVTYMPSQGTITGGNMTVYNDGYKRAITGALGDLSISFTIGEPVKLTAEMKAYITNLAAVAEANPTVTLDPNDLLICTKVSVVTVGGSTFNAKSGSLKMNHKLEDIYAVGLGQYESADFTPTLELSGFKTAGDESDWTALTDRSTKAIVITFGATDGKALKINIPQAAVKSVAESVDQDKIAKSVTYECQNTGTGVYGFQLIYGNVIA